MRTLRIASAIMGVSLLALPTGVHGQQDHLMCYKVVDPLKLSATADLLAIQPEFSQKGCTIVKPIEFCVPASKLNVENAPPGAPSFSGQPLQDDYICYLARCAGTAPPPDKIVTDQFGVRLEQHYRPTKICVPASKLPASCTALNTKGTLCGGECPADQKCVHDAATNQCMCEPATCGGSPDKGGSCGGTCPAPGQVCAPHQNAGGALVCTCQTPGAPCGLTTSGVCGGDCATPNTACMPDANGVCNCVPVAQGNGCALTGNACGGQCPSPNDSCQLVPGAPAPTCDCLPKPCGKDAFGSCSGVCADGTSCTVDATGACVCGPSPCGQVPGANQCGGECPNGEECLPNAANVCACQSPCGSVAGVPCGGACPNPGETCVDSGTGGCTCTPPCGATSANTCGGTCPAGTTCKQVPVKRHPKQFACGCA